MNTTLYVPGLVCLMLFAQACYESASNGENDTSTDTDSDVDIDSDTDTDSSDTDTGSTDEVDTEEEIDWHYFEDFDDYEVGDLISQVDPSNWELWPGGDDAPVSNEEFNSSPNSLEIHEEEEVVLLMGFTSGKYRIKFDIFIEEGKQAYYGFQMVLMGSPGPIWPFEVYLYPGGFGDLIVGDEIYPFEFEDGDWVLCSHLIDIDEDVAILEINGETILKWQYSLPQGGDGDSQIDGVDFYGPIDPPGCRYWLDDIGVEKIN